MAALSAIDINSWPNRPLLTCVDDINVGIGAGVFGSFGGLRGGPRSLESMFYSSRLSILKSSGCLILPY